MHPRSAMQVHSLAHSPQARQGIKSRFQRVHSLESRRFSSILPNCLQYQLERFMRLDAIEHRQAQLDSRSKASREKYPQQRKQAARHRTAVNA